MRPSQSLVEEYRKCLGRECDRGVPGACVDLNLKGLVRQHLNREPELHSALHNEDAFPVIDHALRSNPDASFVLAGLVRGFQALELAAVNLCCFPWRKEFSVIKMFSGGYVHNLKSVFSEEDVAKLLMKIGYAKSTAEQCFRVTRRPTMEMLMLTACAFFAARVECEILAEVLSELNVDKVPAAYMIQERRKSIGGLDGCVERLRNLAFQMGREEQKSHILQVMSQDDLDGDIYTDVSEDLATSRSLHSNTLLRSEDLQLESRLPNSVSGPGFSNAYYDVAVNMREKCMRNGKDVNDSLGQYKAEERKPASVNAQGIYWCKTTCENFDSASSSRHQSPKPEIQVHLSMGVTCMLHDCVIDNACLSYRCETCHILHDILCRELKDCRDSFHHVSSLSEAEKNVILNEIICQRYQAHSCIAKDTLPFYRCDTCQELHYIHCNDLTNCKGREHQVHMIILESDKKLWLRRTQLDMLLKSCSQGSGSWV
ncbi:spermatogenesis-associated protein 2-like protein [Ambystoma mexicanum]|uniref:spermatogenesis-associated protein 2-like protein n=1 Tax=Ambystoma mexicanum TaxID=8296 RepID=UPI0037E9B18D